MDVKARRSRTEPRKQPGTFEEWIASAHLSFSQGDLVAALDDMTRSTTAAGLSASDRDFWGGEFRHHRHGRSPSPVPLRRMPRPGSCSIPPLSRLMRWPRACELSASTVRHYKAAGKLYSYLVNGKLAFPAWQFSDAGDKSIPFLADILGALPDDLHPQAVGRILPDAPA